MVDYGKLVVVCCITLTYKNQDLVKYDAWMKIGNRSFPEQVEIHSTQEWTGVDAAQIYIRRDCFTKVSLTCHKKLMCRL